MTIPSIQKFFLASCVFALITQTAFAEQHLFSNATIYTVDENNAKAQAMVIEGDTILAVGNETDLRENYPDAQQYNLKGATVVPGLIDAHAHLLGLGQALNRVDLVGTKNKGEVLARLVSFASDLAEDQWLLGRGWDQNDWSDKALPTAADLDEAFPDRPVWLGRIDGHAGWANSAAMAFAKRELDGEWQPEGGKIVRDKNGKATGVFIDNAESLISTQIPESTESEIKAALIKAIQKTSSVGLTSVHDAGTSLTTWKILEKMNQAEELDIRFYAMADGNNAMLDFLCEQGAIIDPQAMLTARAIKLYSDGALGSRGAALLDPYSDDPENIGLLIESPEALKSLSLKAAKCDLQVNTHAIGDRGNRVTLDAIEAAKDEKNPGRHRIEHSQVVNEDDFERFKELDLIASVQPTHATSDMYWAEDRLGHERIKGAYAWQTFINNDIPLALGSDFPVERPAPLLGFYAAVSRQDAENWPEEGWYPEQRLTREQALYGFTLGAAYAAFQEDQIGSLEAGKKADFVVLSKDIMQVHPEDILETKILATYLNGKAIYQQD